MVDNRYTGDILGGHARNRRKTYPALAAEIGMVVEDAVTGYCGAIVGFERTYDGDFLRIEDAARCTRLFRLRDGGFLLEGERVTLTRPVAKAPEKLTRSASGSVRVSNVKARTARASRIWVEGVHDAELVEKVWGHDLRVEGVVVEPLSGLDNLGAKLAEFQPGPNRKVGVLVDHLVSGSKEARLTQNLGQHVMVTGHPFVDIWQAVRPRAVGITEWPRIPMGQDWKTGICDALGWGTPQDGWIHVSSSVSSFRDLESDLIGAVERLVDFVTEPGS
ncbi:DUF3097 domain-containing protein [Hoyosella rhizosphaerae]|uniref:DUF3097 domain-containing protein n=1 Tax=Hoyosella rhizosphaerae TaxID=1755582 RepID=A0A916U5R4_9ACTN|nr:DUF3097 domain-containing protein [Hoyosella rhizosphaerae]MBN4926523.1 DUF3097 domain-containing protein [Hoyosella rhizosphaerae]GGC58602.1 hypothetical protein GCM10011410_08880 [Hoyosella rhizosphaerae]